MKNIIEAKTSKSLYLYVHEMFNRQPFFLFYFFLQKRSHNNSIIVISRLGRHGAFFCPLFLRVANPRMQNKMNKIDEVDDANFLKPRRSRGSKICII